MKPLKLWIATTSALIFLSATAMASAPGVVSGSTVIDFNRGQSTISSSDVEELRALIKDAQKKGKVAKVEVAVWSDKEEPAQGDLSSSDKKLARDRAENITNALKMAGTHETIKVFNMTDKSNWLARTLKTSEAELDSVFSKSDVEIKREDFRVIKENGAPSKAVVVVKLRDKIVKNTDKNSTSMSTSY